jgi:hypothetical protein
VSKIKRLTAAAVATAGLSTVLVGVTAAPALAAPCSAARDWTYTWGAKSSCSWEPSWNHRVWIRCEYKEGSATRTGTWYGPWLGTTSTSRAQCPGSTTSVLSYGVEQGYFD